MSIGFSEDYILYEMSLGFAHYKHFSIVEVHTGLLTGIILFQNVIFILVTKRSLVGTSGVLRITCSLEQESKVDTCTETLLVIVCGSIETLVPSKVEVVDHGPSVVFR